MAHPTATFQAAEATVEGERAHLKIRYQGSGGTSQTLNLQFTLNAQADIVDMRASDDGDVAPFTVPKMVAKGVVKAIEIWLTSKSPIGRGIAFGTGLLGEEGKLQLQALLEGIKSLLLGLAEEGGGVPPEVRIALDFLATGDAQKFTERCLHYGWRHSRGT